MRKSEPRHRDDWKGRTYTPKMKAHLEAVRPKHGEKGFINPNGRPTKQELVRAYRKKNPDAKKYQCHEDLGIDPKTIRKWWDT